MVGMQARRGADGSGLKCSWPMVQRLGLVGASVGEKAWSGGASVRFEDYVAQHGPSLLRFAYVLTGDPHLAEDLTQTTLTDAYRHWRRVDGAQNREAYVRRIMVNRNLAWHRRRSSTEVPSEHAPNLGVTGDVADDVASRDRTRRLLAGLAPRARTVLLLRYYADLDDAAIAEVMEISQSAVRATASRALATLRGSRWLRAESPRRMGSSSGRARAARRSRHEGQPSSPEPMVSSSA